MPEKIGNYRAAQGKSRLPVTLRSIEKLYKLVMTKGPDAMQFLQGQLTQDLHRTTDVCCLPAAWCNPRGRVISTIRILVVDGGFGLVVPASIAEAFVQRLTMYRLRAKVAIELSGPQWLAMAISGADGREQLYACSLLPDTTMNACKAAAGLHAVSTGHDFSTVELFGEEAAFAAVGLDNLKSLSSQQWQAARIRAGSADIGRECAEKYTPHMLNLDLTGAVSFSKGCYTGQEIVARTEHLGKSKRRLRRYVGAHPASAGDRLLCDGEPVAEVVNAAGDEVLAVAALSGPAQPLELAGVAFEPAELPYPVPTASD